ncbi:MAG: hypothetical protein ACRCZZ_00550, partial [Phocaeicola sp.]
PSKPGYDGRYFGPEATETGTGGEFIPAAGLLDDSTGRFSFFGACGYFWSGTTHTDLRSSAVYFDSSIVTTSQTTLQGFGFPIRCVPQ